jgi:hypothetical protein
MIALYMDHHVPRAITEGLRLRGIDVITAYEDGAENIDDPGLLDRSTSLNRVLFTQDDDLLTEANRRQKENIPFAGLIYSHQLQVSIGACIKDLEIISKAGSPEDLRNHVQFLPL